MSNLYKKIGYCFIIVLLFNSRIYAQCASGTASAACSGTLLVSGTTYNSATTLKTSTASYGNITLNAAGITLMVCGNATLTSLTLNAADNVIIEPGATLNVTNAWIDNISSVVTNYGTLNYSGNVDMNGGDLYNQTGSVINITGALTVNNASSNLINKGTINAGSMLISSGGVCLDNNTCINITGNFENDANNSVTNGSAAPTQAAIKYGGTFVEDGTPNPVSGSSTIKMCENGGATPTSTYLGSATFTSTCPTAGYAHACSSILPIELLSFTAKKRDKVIQLNWTTASEINNDYFTIERSIDGIDFESILTVKGAGNSHQIINYTATDPDPPFGIFYYHLKQTDYDGKFENSYVIAVENNDNRTYVIYPNPSDGNELYIKYSSQNAAAKDEDVIISIYNVVGELVFGKLMKGNFDKPLSLIYAGEHLPKGIYTVKVSCSNEVKCEKLIVK